MKILTFEQQTPEWFDARRGIPTASNFSKILTTKGEKILNNGMTIATSSLLLAYLGLMKNHLHLNLSRKA